MFANNSAYTVYNVHIYVCMSHIDRWVAQDEIKVDITLGHVGRHCILHALTVIEAAISQVCSSIYVYCLYTFVCQCVIVCVYMCVCKCAVKDT